MNSEEKLKMAKDFDTRGIDPDELMITLEDANLNEVFYGKKTPLDDYIDVYMINNRINEINDKINKINAEIDHIISSNGNIKNYYNIIDNKEDIKELNLNKYKLLYEKSKLEIQLRRTGNLRK